MQELADALEEEAQLRATLLYMKAVGYQLSTIDPEAGAKLIKVADNSLAEMDQVEERSRRDTGWAMFIIAIMLGCLVFLSWLF